MDYTKFDWLRNGNNKRIQTPIIPVLEFRLEATHMAVHVIKGNIAFKIYKECCLLHIELRWQREIFTLVRWRVNNYSCLVYTKTGNFVVLFCAHEKGGGCVMHSLNIMSTVIYLRFKTMLIRITKRWFYDISYTSENHRYLHQL